MPAVIFPMTMEDWAKRLDIYLQADDLEVLKDAGKISAQLAKMHAETEFEKYRVVQDRLYQSDFDRYLKQIQLNRTERRYLWGRILANERAKLFGFGETGILLAK